MRWVDPLLQLAVIPQKHHLLMQLANSMAVSVF
jgi:hypothetical protein